MEAKEIFQILSTLDDAPTSEGKENVAQRTINLYRAADLLPMAHRGVRTCRADTISTPARLVIELENDVKELRKWDADHS